MESYSGKILHLASYCKPSRKMATGYALPPPAPLKIDDPNPAEKWEKFLLAWENYALVTELNKKAEAVQVATLLTVIGEEAREVYSTFNDWGEGEDKKINPVLKKLGDYCEPRKNIPFERYKFNRRVQEAGETYDQYRTALRKLAESCDSVETITAEEILRDRLVFGIRGNKVRERLLREAKLTLEKTDEVCRASESMLAQMKVVGNNVAPQVPRVSAVNNQRKKHKPQEGRKKNPNTQLQKNVGAVA